jgi:formylglycine-generating enzyme required for sulfatase activity
MSATWAALIAATAALLLGCSDGHHGERAAPPPEPPPEPPPGMVTVPAGKFIGGVSVCFPGTLTQRIPGKEFPKDEVQELPTYFIDRELVPCDAYRRCVANGICEPPPIELVGKECSKLGGFARASLAGASQYCSWRGGRLPTVAEWQKAARGTEGLLTPTGDQLDDDVACVRALGVDPDRRFKCVNTSPFGMEYVIYTNDTEWTRDVDCIKGRLAPILIGLGIGKLYHTGDGTTTPPPPGLAPYRDATFRCVKEHAP